MTVTIYYNPACSTSRNVLGLIRNTGEEPYIIEYLKTPPSRHELASLVGQMGFRCANCCAGRARPTTS